MITIGCVLKTGGDFDWEYVRTLHDSVARNYKGEYQFRVLADDWVPSFDIRQLRQGLPGWWSKIELFHPETREAWGDTLYFDLDTAIVGDLTPIIDYCAQDWRDPTAGTPFTILEDFYRPQGYGSGMMFIPRHFTAPWLAFNKASHTTVETLAGDQDFLEAAVPQAARWQMVCPKQIVSFKPAAVVGLQLTAVPSKARVVCFHGFPRPHQLPKDHFMRRYWRADPQLVVNNPEPAAKQETWDEHMGWSDHVASDGF